MKKKGPSFPETFRHFKPLKEYFVNNLPWLILGLLSLLLVDFLQLLIPLVIEKAVDLLAERAANPYALFEQGAKIAVIAMAIAAFRYLWRLLIFGHSRRVEEGLRNKLYEHLQDLSMSFYQKTKTGDIMARSINDINAVRMGTGMGLVALTDGIVLGIAAIGFMLSISVSLTLISLIPAPFIIILTKILTRRMSTGFKRVQASFSDLSEHVREAFSGIRVIKAYARESWEYGKTREQGEQYISENMDLARTMAFFFPLMTLFTNVGLAVVLGWGGSLTIIGNISTGEFVAFISYLNLLTWPMMAMGWVANLIQRASASMGRINNLLEEQPEIKDMAPVSKVYLKKGKIRISGLSFRYPDQLEDALTNIGLCIDPGETIAVVGKVGSGKTTLLNMLPRLLEAPVGSIFIDDLDIRTIPLQKLRSSIGFVPQDVFVFSDTIRNNVVFGTGGVSEDHFETVLHGAGILDEVKGLEKGADTILGERGITISGGQRQRLSIARALIPDPPVFIMDDALSMVDTRTEKMILDRILKLRRDKTNIIVSHRVSTLMRVERIVVLDRGRLVEEGKHEELLALGGHYADIYERQAYAEKLRMEQEKV